MALFAQIKFTQDGAPGNAGEAFLGAPTLPVTTEQDPGEESSDLIGSWVMTLLNAPAASGYSTLTPLELGAADTDTPITSSLVPDVPGSYRVRLRIWGLAGQVGPSSTDIRNFIVPEPKHGFVVPPYQQDPLPLPTIASGSATAKPNEMNIGGLEYGWMGDGTDGLVATAIKKLDASNFDIVPDPTTTGDVLTATAGFANCNVPNGVVLHGDSAWFCNTGAGFIPSNPGGGVTRVSKTTQKITERLGLGDGGGTIARIPTFVVSAGLRLFLIYFETDSTTYFSVFAHEILVGAPGSSSFGTAYLIWTEATPEQVTPSGAVYDAANDIIWLALQRFSGTSFVIGVSVPFMVVGTPVTIAGAAEPIFDLILDTDTSHYGDVAQRLYTVDAVNARVVRIKNLATTPTLDGFFAAGVSGKGALLAIGGGAAGPGGGRIYVCNYLGGNISSFNTAGTLLIGPVVIGVPVFTVTYEATNDSLIVAALATNQVQISALDASDLATPLATPILLPPTDEALGPSFISRYKVHGGYVWAYSPSTNSIFGAFEPAGHIYRIDSIGLTNVVELLTVGTAAWAPGGGGGLPGFEDIPNFNLAVGTAVLGAVTTGSGNTAIGVDSAPDITDGNSNTALGDHSLFRVIGGDDNVAIGGAAGYGLETGNANVAVGRAALSTSIAGSFNVAIGGFALQDNSVSENTAVGYAALKSNTSSLNNSAFGFAALAFSNGGARCTAVGYQALFTCVSGSDNTAVGYLALTLATTGQQTAVGASALAANTTGIQNTAVGYKALEACVSGGGNTAVGFQALKAATGINNTALGSNALGAATGDDNTVLGSGAAPVATSADRNVVVGKSAAALLSTGDDNVIIGKSAGVTLTTGSTNVLIADDVPTAGTSNYLGIGSGTITGDVSTKQITFRRKTTAGITASTTQTQGNGALTSDVNQISVCANANDTVTLPAALAGLEVIVINSGANTLQVFPASGDNLGFGVNTATTQIPGRSSRYTAYDTTNWVISPVDDPIQRGVVRTTNATATTIITYAGLSVNDRAVQLTVRVTGLKDNFTEAAGYYFTGTFRRTGGTITQVGSTLMIAQNEDTASWDATLTISGTNILVQVTGVAATNIDWQAVLEAVKNI